MSITRGFPNGRYPDHALMAVDSNGTRLSDRAAPVLLRAIFDAKRAGVEVRPTPALSSQPKGLAGYRNLDTQRWLIAKPLGPVDIAPAGMSTHGFGDAIDIDRGADWLWKNRRKYGLTRPLASEPWHFQLNNTLAELGLKPADNREDDIMLAKIHQRGSKFIVSSPFIEGGGFTTGIKRIAWAAARNLLPNGVSDIIDASRLSDAEWGDMAAGLPRIAPPAGGGSVTLPELEFTFPELEITASGKITPKA